ncbi:MAG: hypothetical protein V7763_00825 [Sulfitobacter sp.]|jgi:uncharacterized protein YjbJ (UPF0337 family)|uniref:hypothetical protein n=1 Tax=Sulfitobacter sp. TaxID=1903071 RepID=UPI00268D7087|tara:strand:- start:12828 stop:13394 length:567 start_codon:yes stop_codon:yes gene_type:complete
MTNINKDSTGTDTSMTEKAKEAAGSASEQVKAHAKDVADTVATEAGNYAGQAKDAAADEVKNVSSALRTAADEMRRGSPQERTFSQIADGLADASDSLRDKDLGEMVTAVSDFAKRNPLVFLGSAALIGFAATRFAKASRTGSSRADYGDRNDDRMARPAPGIPSSTANQAGGVQSPAIAPNRERNNL